MREEVDSANTPTAGWQTEQGEIGNRAEISIQTP